MTKYLDLPDYFDFKNSPEGQKTTTEKIIVENLIIKQEFTSTIFVLIKKMVSIFYHYDYIDKNLHKRHKLRELPLFVAA